MTDWAIDNGWIVDGTSAPRFRGGVAVVRDGSITGALPGRIQRRRGAVA